MRRTVVIDTCCTLNLLATRREVEMVTAVDVYLLDTPQVSAESLTLWTPPDDEGAHGKEPASTASLRNAGRLATRELDSDALIDAFVTAAARISDADASCIALAGTLELPLLTDDRKERSIARELFPSIELLSTLDILDEAARLAGWTREELEAAARDLRIRGRFAPPRQDPRGAWYDVLTK